MGLDLPATPPPPLTSFTGFRSRIMASFMSSLTRRQADRTILMFGICVFMFKWPPPIISQQRFRDESGREQAEKLFDSVRDVVRTNRSPLSTLGRARASRSRCPLHRKREITASCDGLRCIV